MFRNALAAAVETAWAEEQRFMAALSPAERAEEGSHDAWSAKDLIAHVAAAKRRLVRAIDGELDTLEHDEPSVYAEHANDTWLEVESAARCAAADLASRIDRRVDAAWLEGRSLASFVAGYAIRHPLAHIVAHHDARGDAVEAARVRSLEAELLARVAGERFLGSR